MRDAEIKSAELSARDEIAKTAAFAKLSDFAPRLGELMEKAKPVPEMVERVARAILLQHIVERWPPTIGEEVKEICRIQAKAAIEAMMEPTNAMLDEAEGQLGFESADLFWKAMLRKALGP